MKTFVFSIRVDSCSWGEGPVRISKSVEADDVKSARAKIDEEVHEGFVVDDVEAYSDNEDIALGDEDVAECLGPGPRSLIRDE